MTARAASRTTSSRRGAAHLARKAASAVSIALILAAVSVAVMWPSPAASASVGSTHPKAQSPAAPTAVKYYIVPPAQHGSVETLSVIAARTLGSSELYMEIFTLNKGRLQPNGARLETPHTIDPGWILVLPGIATGPGVHFGLLPGQHPRVAIAAPHKAVAAATAPYSAAGWVVPGAAIALVLAAAGLGIWLSLRRRHQGRAESGHDRGGRSDHDRGSRFAHDRGIPAADGDDCDLAWLESLDDYPWAGPRSGPALHPDHPSAPLPRVRDQDQGWDPPAGASRGWDSPATPARGSDRPAQRTSDGRDPLQWWPTAESAASGSRRTRAVVPAPEVTPAYRDQPEPPGTYATAQLETHHGHELRLAEYDPAASAGLYQQEAVDLREPDSLGLASRVLSEADQQAAAIRAAAQQEAARVRQLATDDAVAVREAADRDAAELRAAVTKLRTELGDVAAYITENLPVVLRSAGPGVTPDSDPEEDQGPGQADAPKPQVHALTPHHHLQNHMTIKPAAGQHG